MATGIGTCDIAWLGSGTGTEGRAEWDGDLVGRGDAGGVDAGGVDAGGVDAGGVDAVGAPGDGTVASATGADGVVARLEDVPPAGTLSGGGGAEAVRGAGTWAGAEPAAGGSVTVLAPVAAGAAPTDAGDRPTASGGLAGVAGPGPAARPPGVADHDGDAVVAGSTSRASGCPLPEPALGPDPSGRGVSCVS